MADAAQDQLRQTRGSEVGELKDAALDQVERVGAQAGRIADGVTDQAKQAGEKVREVASTVNATVRQSIKDQPLATLAVVAALGFALGAFWKAR